MKTAQLNGFSCGIVVSEIFSLDEIEEIKKEWSRNGMICWISRRDFERNQESPDDEYNMNKTSQPA